MDLVVSNTERDMRDKNEILPDTLRYELDLVICGAAADNKSSKFKFYYAGSGNKFWSILKETGLTPIELKPHNYKRLTDFGIGLTDLAKQISGPDKVLQQEDYDLVKFREKIIKYQPYVVGFNGKESAKKFLCKDKVGYGRQDVQIGDTILFTLPSTSNSANGVWDPNYWYEIANLVKIRQIEN